MRKGFGATLAFLFGLTVASPALAGDMDPTPERLVIQPPGLPAGQTCQSIAANPNFVVAAGLRPQDFTCQPNNQAFKNMISELGFAIAPNAFYTARTTGIGGFQVSLQASYTGISADRSVPGSPNLQYWHLGTRGSQDPNSKQSSVTNTSPDSVLQLYSIKARKGLPYGFEVAGEIGTLSGTQMWVGGGDIRWSLFEGFRTGLLGYAPDLSLGTGLRTVTGTSQFYLTTVGIDVRVSKPIALQDSSQIIPTVGFQRLLIFGDSNVVDSTPNVNAVAQCGFQGLDANGAVACKNKLANGQDNNGDFANNFTFSKVRIQRSRLMLALNYRYEMAYVGSQIAFDITDPKDENPGLVGSRQWTWSFEAGVHF